MQKKLPKPKQFLNTDPFSDKMNPAVVYKPKNIIDVPVKVKIPKEDRLVDEAGFNLCNDKTAFPFREASKYVERSFQIEMVKNEFENGRYTRKDSSSLSRNSTYSCLTNHTNSLSQIKRQLSVENRPKDDKLERVRINYGNKLSEFMTDSRHGVMSQKYEKVFIY
jgi:hypothetical protein